MAEISSEEQKEKTARYRRVFNTPDGRLVLSDMVLELGVFDSIAPTDPERMALRNYGLTVLYNVGGLVDKNIQSVIDNMLSLDYIIEDAPKSAKEN